MKNINKYLKGAAVFLTVFLACVFVNADKAEAAEYADYSDRMVIILSDPQRDGKDVEAEVKELREEYEKAGAEVISADIEFTEDGETNIDVTGNITDYLALAKESKDIKSTGDAMAILGKILEKGFSNVDIIVINSDTNIKDYYPKTAEEMKPGDADEEEENDESEEEAVEEVADETEDAAEDEEDAAEDEDTEDIEESDAADDEAVNTDMDAEVASIVVEEARKEAEEILAQARLEAEKIVEDAKKQAEEELKKIEEEKAALEEAKETEEPEESVEDDNEEAKASEEALIEEAKEEADKIISEAKKEAEEIGTNAREEAEQIVNDAKEEAKEIVDQANSQAEAEAEAAAESYEVVKGDCLWNIALEHYGDGSRWVDIYEANSDVISNPSCIEIGQVFVLP